MTYEKIQHKNVADLVKKHRAPNDRAWKLRFYRRVSWSIVADKVHRRFQHAADEARRELPWEHLYVHKDVRSRSVSMWFGQHPLPGVIEDDLEVGASLVVSQDPRGGVAVLFFPFESLNLQQSKPKVIWNYFEGPELLTEGVLRRLLHDFFSYARATTGLMAPTAVDRRHVEMLEERSRALERETPLSGLHSWALAALVLGSLATFALLVVWMHTEKSDPWEPLTGMVGLVTGWIAAAAQKLGKSHDDARARALELEATEKGERDRRLKEKREMVRERRQGRRAAH